MPTEVLMPKLGLTMQEGTITDWVVESGSTVTAGTVLLTIETDKVEAEVEAAADGVLTQVAAAGDTLDCGALAGWLLAEGEEPPIATDSSAAQVAEAAESDAAATAVVPGTSADRVVPPTGRILASPNARRVAKERGIDLAVLTGTGPGGRITSEDVPESAPTQSLPRTTRNAGFVPYVVRSLAVRLGVDVDSLVGAGPAGRVTRADVYGAPRATRPSAPVAGPQPGDIIPLSGMRGVIADRMASSLSGSAQLSLFMDVNMDRVVELRNQLREIGPEELGVIPGYTDFVVAAVARALQAHPVVNSSVVADAIQLHSAIHVGVAVALDDGLVVPVVSHADSLPLADLAAETARLAEGAKSKSLGLAELEGSTITVTALGMFGVDGFTPIINQPNTAIVGVGRLRDETAWTDSGPARTSVLTISLTWDHRAFDGAPAASFAGAIRDLLEQPLRLLA